GEGVEHADHDDVGRAVDRGDDLGREARRRVDDDPVEVIAEDRVHLTKELRTDRARLVRPARGDQRPYAGRVRRQERVELVVVERTRRLGEVVDRLLRGKPETEG